MALSSDIQNDVPTTAPTGEKLSKAQLVGALVVYRLIEFVPDYPGKYGSQPMARVECLVVDGPHAGTHEPERWEFGVLAKQFGSQNGDGTHACKITSGAGSLPGSTWYGCDFDLSEEELAIARAAVEKFTAAAPAVPTAKTAKAQSAPW